MNLKISEDEATRWAGKARTQGVVSDLRGRADRIATAGKRPPGLSLREGRKSPKGTVVVSHISRRTSEMPRISCTLHWTNPRCAPFFKERRMKFIEALSVTGNRGYGAPGFVVGADFKSDCGAAPFVFGPCPLRRTWAPVDLLRPLLGHRLRDLPAMTDGPARHLRVLSRNTTRTIRTTNKNAFKTNSIGIICCSLLGGWIRARYELRCWYWGHLKLRNCDCRATGGANAGAASTGVTGKTAGAATFPLDHPVEPEHSPGRAT